jgi:hypothetical protein
MRLDHLSYAAEHDGLRATAARLGAAIGVEPVDGGLHPRFGTRNVVLPLAGGHYVEVVEVLEHPVADKAPYGRAVRARSQAGGGWLGWAVAVDDLAPFEARLGREAVPGNRHRPDGVELRWHQIGINGLIADPQLPFFTRWEVEAGLHPSVDADGTVKLAGLRIAGSPERLCEWLGQPGDHPLDEVDVEWVAPHGTPGLLSAFFDTPTGRVEV